MSFLHRRGFLKAGAACALSAPFFGVSGRVEVASKTLVIAYHTPLPGLDPARSPQSANPTVQSIYKALYDPYIDQNPNLSFKPGILTKWAWQLHKSRIALTIRRGALWHDGKPVTADDLAWSLVRAADPASGNPMQFAFGKMAHFQLRGDTVTVELKEFEPAMLKWLAFLTAYILPEQAFTAAGKDWDNQAIGSGPYRLDKFERNGFIRLKRFDKYWGPKPAFETVIYKFVPDPVTRVAEIESGSADITLEVPYEVYDRLRRKPGLAGVSTPVSDLGIIFLSNKGVMRDSNVRKAAAHAIDKKTLVQKVLSGYGVPVDTLQAPQYAAYDPTIKVPYDPALARQLLAASGFSPENPAKLIIQTTRGYKPKDFEMISAIVGMWRKVGIEAEVEVYDIAHHFQLLLKGELAPAAFYNWGNAIGDPSTSTGAAMLGPFAAWKSDDAERRVAALTLEQDEARRIAGYKAVDRYFAQQAYVIPLLQYVQPIVHKKHLKVTPFVAGGIVAQAVK